MGDKTAIFARTLSVSDSDTATVLAAPIYLRLCLKPTLWYNLPELHQPSAQTGRAVALNKFQRLRLVRGWVK